VDIVVSAITGLPSSLNALSLIGITSDDDGNLSIDDDDFKDAFEDNFAGLRRIFVAEGSTTDGDVQYVDQTNDTVAGDYDVNITTAATQAQATGTNDLSGGIASNLSTITVTDGSKTAAVTLDSSDNGSTIDNIVNAVNSELDTEYAQSIMGNVKNTAGDATTAITSSTTWDNVWSDGATAGLLDNNSYEITFTGHKSSGTAVSGSYTISDAGDDTVQGLLSAIEAAYGHEVSAGMNTYGYLTITDNTTGNSQLDITITQPESLNFGEVTTSNLVGSVRNTSGAAPGGSAIDTSTKFKAGATGIYGSTLAADGTETIYFSGYTVSGNAVEGSFTIDDAQADQDDVGDFLSAIETAYNAAGGSATAEIHDGRIVIKDGLTNSTLGIEILEPSGGGVDFGTLSGGVTGRYAVAVTASKDGSSQLVLTHDEYGSSESFTVQLSDTDLGTGAGASDLQDNQAYSGVDVAGTINNEAATGSGQLLTGDAPGSGETTSVEGLTIKVTLTAAQLASQGQDQGNVKITMGVAELFDRALYDITNVSDGYLDYKIESLADRIDDFETQIGGMEVRLDRKMETMINRFVAMELALAKIQNMSDWLTGQVNTVSRGWV
jgi:flagellar hook-associated protein 2